MLDTVPSFCPEMREEHMNKKIILLNGPSSSGKSSLSKALQELIADMRSEAYEIVSIDDFMKVSTSETIYEDDVYEISGEMCEKIRELFNGGKGVIIDHVITSERIYDQLIDSMAPDKVDTVHIVCPLDVLLRREEERGDRCVGSAESSYTYLYPKDGYDAEVNTGVMSSEEAASKIYSELF